MDRSPLIAGLAAAALVGASGFPTDMKWSTQERAPQPTGVQPSNRKQKLLEASLRRKARQL